MSVLSLVNGNPAGQLDLSDRGLAFGDGLFETIRLKSGVPVLLPYHIARLAAGCQRLHIELDVDTLQAEIHQLAQSASAGEQVLKVIVTREYQQRGYRYSSPCSANRYLQINPLDTTLRQMFSSGVALRYCHHGLPINPALAGIKHLNRLDNVLARAEWSDDTIAEGLMLDAEGRVVEGTMSNVFIVRDNQLATPSLQRCGVAGVVRQAVIDNLARQCGVTVVEDDLWPRDLEQASELFICNSLIGICPVTSLDGNTKTPGVLTSRLQALLEEAI